MKIANIGNIQSMMNVYKNQGLKTNESKSASRMDEVQISSEALDFQTVLNAAKNIPDIRQDKVNELKQQIDSGTYRVDAHKIAEKMLNSARRI